MDKLTHQKEVKRAQLLDLLKANSISWQEASKRIGISTRQVRRLAKRYQCDGLDGLISKKRGVASNRRLAGGLGADTMNGGASDDVLLFDNLDTLDGSDGNDIAQVIGDTGVVLNLAQSHI